MATKFIAQMDDLAAGLTRLFSTRFLDARKTFLNHAEWMKEQLRH